MVVFAVIVLAVIALLLVAASGSDNNNNNVPSRDKITQTAQANNPTSQTNRATATSPRATALSTPTQFQIGTNTPGSPIGSGCEFAPTYAPVNIGNTAEVTGDGGGLRLRQVASVTADQLRELRTGTQMLVIGGPTCSDGYRWWQVQLASDGTLGWVADGDQNELWVQWVSNVPTIPAITDFPTVIVPAVSPTPFVSFSSSQGTINSGECVTIWWDVENISQVYYEGEGVTGHDNRTACPTSATTYTLRVVYLNGTEESYFVTVEVMNPDAMKRLTFLLLLLAFTALGCTVDKASAPGHEGEQAHVLYVIDGDTIQVSMNGQEYRVRYVSVNTPERDEPCYADATNANADLVEDQTVTLVRDVSDTDRYGRLLRYVYVGNTFVNAELVRDGWAEAREYPPDTAQYNTLEDLESDARSHNLGCHPTGIFR